MDVGARHSKLAKTFEDRHEEGAFTLAKLFCGDVFVRLPKAPGSFFRWKLRNQDTFVARLTLGNL